MAKKPTMTDIANELGVSQTLVSFVLSGKNDMGISADTKKRVLMTAEKMGYCSSSAAKMIKLGRCGYASLVFEKSRGQFIAEIIGGINDALSQYGYSLVALSGTDADGCQKIFGDKKTDGFIVYSDKALFEKLTDLSIPAVLLNDNTADIAGKKALELCEIILSCEDKSNNTKERSTKKAVKREINAEKQSKTDASENTQRESKKESIWLL